MKLRLVLFVNLIAVTVCAQILENHSGDVEQVKRRKGNKNKQKDGKVKKREKWVVDSIFYGDYQSDGPGSTENHDFCPPVPDVIDEDACAKDSCTSDVDCDEAYRCCFNGCAYSCLFEVQPAPVVDWLKEPRRSRSGIAWLLPDKKPVTLEAEPCTTGPFEADEDPLLCPHGYFCYVDKDKKRKKKKSNTGYCVKHSDDQYSPGETEMALTAALKGRRICHVDGIMLLDGASLRLSDKKCNCKNGYLSCVSNDAKTKQMDVKVKSKTSGRRKKDNKKRRKRKKNKNKLGRQNRT